MAIDPGQLRQVITDTLQTAPRPIATPGAVELLMGTAAHESHLGTYLRQIKGPALGMFQMEPATHDSLWRNYLRYRVDLSDWLLSLAVRPSADQLVTNLAYATAMARIRYLPAPEPIPNDLQGWAQYWDKWYNRNPDKGFPEQFVADYERFVTRRL